MDFVEARKALGADGEPYQWNREDAYEERESRFHTPHTSVRFVNPFSPGFTLETWI